MAQSWNEYRLYIERTLERLEQWHEAHNVKLDAITTEQAALRSEIKLLKFKAAVIGAAMGAAASAAGSIVLQHFFK